VSSNGSDRRARTDGGANLGTPAWGNNVDHEEQDNSGAKAWLGRNSSPLAAVALLTAILGVVTISAFTPFLLTGVDTLWCGVFGCPEPVTAAQTDVVVVEETVPTTDGSSNVSSPAGTESGAGQQTAVPAAEPLDANATTAATTNESAETATTVTANEGVDTVSTASSGAETDPTPRSTETSTPESVVSDNVTFMSGVGFGTPWLMLIPLFVLITLFLVGLIRYQRLRSDDSAATESNPEPAAREQSTLQTDGGDTAFDGGDPAESVTPTGAAGGQTDSPTMDAIRLDRARDHLQVGATDAAVVATVESVAAHCGDPIDATDYREALEALEADGDETGLDTVRDQFEQAAFGRGAVTDDAAEECIETIEQLLTSNSL